MICRFVPRISALPASAFLVSVTQLGAQAQSLRSAAVVPTSNINAVTLDQLSVEGAEGATVGYLQKRTRTATKTDTPLIDTPQSVSVVTQQQIRDQGFQSLNEAIRYVPGVIPH